MLELSCVRCGTRHFSGEDHIGKHIRCVGCGDVIPITYQDGRYRASDCPIEPISKARGSSPAVQRLWNALTRPRRGSRRRLPYAIVAAFGLLLIATAGLVAFHWFSSHPSLPALSAVSRSTPTLPELSPDEVETVTPNATDPRPNVQSDVSGDPFLLNGHMVNGSRLSPDLFTSGHGLLTVVNGTGADAVVNLVVSSTNETARSVYIRSGTSFTLEHIGPRAYRVIFSTGSNWDEKQQSFLQYPAYYEFGKILFFSEESKGNSLLYSHFTITLNPVPDGDVPQVNIDASKFHASMPRRQGSLIR